jgi:drug/metabolite transporter (DMT)-like permease
MRPGSRWLAATGLPAGIRHGTEPLVLSAAQLTVGALLLGVAMPWIGSQPIKLSSTVVLSVVALGVLSTGIAYVLNYRLIQDEGPTAASMTNYLARRAAASDTLVPSEYGEAQARERIR